MPLVSLKLATVTIVTLYNQFILIGYSGSGQKLSRNQMSGQLTTAVVDAITKYTTKNMLILGYANIR